MTGHKTSGSWTDVTSIGRNEIVFEGRNKDYGAFYVRQRYNKALLLALLTAISIGVLCAAVPFVMSMFIKPAPKVIPKTGTMPTLVNYVEHHHVIPNIQHPIIPNIIKAIKNPPPVIVNSPVIDTINTNTKTNDHTVGVNNNKHPGPDSVDPNNHVTVIEDHHKNDPPPTIVEVMPKFDGNLPEYFAKNINYPQNERELGRGGVVFLTFIVEADGSISNVTLLRGVSGSPDFDNEALRVVRAMPKWLPGQQNGHPVRVQFNLPVHFTVQ